MLLTTIENIPGKEYNILGLVQGNCVQATNIGRDIKSLFKNITGGEVTDYTKMMITTRDTATKRMIDCAEKIGADAIIGIRYTSSQVMDGCAEIQVYGTAVKLV